MEAIILLIFCSLNCFYKKRISSLSYAGSEFYLDPPSPFSLSTNFSLFNMNSRILCFYLSCLHFLVHNNQKHGHSTTISSSSNLALHNAWEEDQISVHMDDVGIPKTFLPPSPCSKLTPTLNYLMCGFFHAGLVLHLIMWG